MQRTEEIKVTFERNAKAMALRPAVWRGTAVTKVKLRDGLTCDVEDGAWKHTVDMSPKSGGEGRGPGERVLDIACGTGLVTFPAARAVGPGGRVVGTDLSQEMVNVRPTKLERATSATPRSSGWTPKICRSHPSRLTWRCVRSD
jgi:2-polyprenyl-3-methyl-5-hydroxy-6-metoxy-1,4-benzoquinol methylase